MDKKLSNKPVTEKDKLPFSNAAITKWIPTYGDSKDSFIKKLTFWRKRFIKSCGFGCS